MSSTWTFFKSSLQLFYVVCVMARFAERFACFWESPIRVQTVIIAHMADVSREIVLKAFFRPGEKRGARNMFPLSRPHSDQIHHYGTTTTIPRLKYHKRRAAQQWRILFKCKLQSQIVTTLSNVRRGGNPKRQHQWTIPPARVAINNQQQTRHHHHQCVALNWKILASLLWVV